MKTFFEKSIGHQRCELEHNLLVHYPFGELRFDDNGKLIFYTGLSTRNSPIIITTGLAVDDGDNLIEANH